MFRLFWDLKTCTFFFEQKSALGDEHGGNFGVPKGTPKKGSPWPFLGPSGPWALLAARGLPKASSGPTLETSPLPIGSSCPPLEGALGRSWYSKGVFWAPFGDPKASHGLLLNTLWPSSEFPQAHWGLPCFAQPLLGLPLTSAWISLVFSRRSQRIPSGLWAFRGFVVTPNSLRKG